jgi:hypothetical protein
MIPNVLIETIEIIKSSNIKFETSHRETRQDSSIVEDQIIELLKKHSDDNKEYNASKLRDWCDIEIKDKNNDITYYCNIKAPNDLKTQADNAGSPKNSIGYVLTGLEPKFLPSNWTGFMKFLEENYKNITTTDYWYIVIPKTNIQETFVNSMKGLSKLTPNGNNLPFQIDWSKNRDYNPFNDERDNQKILNVFYSSWKKRSEPFNILDQLYKKCF